jgi:hypothetical protein
MPTRRQFTIVERYKPFSFPRRTRTPHLTPRQYIFHPGGHVPDPRNSAGNIAIRDALVIGVRQILKF